MLVYASPIWTRGDRLERLRAEWLPYYREELRLVRLDAIRRCCFDHLDHIPPYLERGLYSQLLDRLYRAFRGFLQGLHVSRRVYPIAYDKWIREQVVDILGLPELYARLPRLFEVQRFESDELAGEAEELQRMLEAYVVP